MCTEGLAFGGKGVRAMIATSADSPLQRSIRPTKSRSDRLMSAVRATEKASGPPVGLALRTRRQLLLRIGASAADDVNNPSQNTNNTAPKEASRVLSKCGPQLCC